MTQTASSKKSLWIYLEAGSQIFIIILLRRRRGSRKIGWQKEEDTKWEIVKYWEEGDKTTGTSLVGNRSFCPLRCELQLLLSSTTKPAGLGPLLFAQNLHSDPQCKGLFIWDFTSCVSSLPLSWFWWIINIVSCTFFDLILFLSRSRHLWCTISV